MRQLLSDIEKLGCGCHTRAPKPISVSCVCRGAEARRIDSHAASEGDSAFANRAAKRRGCDRSGEPEGQAVNVFLANMYSPHNDPHLTSAHLHISVCVCVWYWELVIEKPKENSQPLLGCDQTAKNSQPASAPRSVRAGIDGNFATSQVCQ